MKWISFATFAIATACAMPPPPLHIVADGDSRTAGYFHSLGPASYPTQLSVLLDVPASEVVNIGVAGAKTSDILATHITETPKAGSDNWIVLWVGFNDFNTLVPYADTLRNLTEIVTRYHALGFRVMTLTEAPGNLPGQLSGYESWRQAFNDWILTLSAGQDYVCDSGRAPEVADTSDTTIYSDSVHDTTEGYRRIAARVSACFMLVRMKRGHGYVTRP